MQNQVIPIKITPDVRAWSLIVFLMFQPFIFAQEFPSEGIPLSLTALIGVEGTVNIPTHAAVPFQHNMLTADDFKRLVVVVESNRNEKIPIQSEITAKWADKNPKTVKWIKIYFTAKIINGVPQKYRLFLSNDSRPRLNKSKLKRTIIDGTSNNTFRGEDGFVLRPGQSIVIGRNSYKATISSDFSGFSLTNPANKNLLVADSKSISGPFLKSGNKYFYPDPNGKVVIETTGDNLVVVKATGNFINETLEDQDPFQYTCRVFFYAGSPLIKVQNSITFTKDMRISEITDHGYNLGAPAKINDPRDITAYKDCGAGIGDKLFYKDSIFFTQESDSRYVFGRSSTLEEHDGQLNGRFEVESQLTNLNVFVSNFWQKYPNQLFCDRNKISVKTWSANYRDNLVLIDEQLERKNIYKFLSFHQGGILNLQIPEAYFNNESLLVREGSAEDAATNACYATAIGSSMFQEFYLSYDQLEAENLRLLPLLKNYPIVLPSQKWIAESGVFGDVSEKIAGYDAIENTILDGQLSYANPERGKNYGKFNFGDFNHEWKLETNTPDLHRAWFNNHYLFGTALWQTLALRNDTDDNRLTTILNRARILTEHYSSVDQCRFSNNPRNVGSFWHGKSWVHWAGEQNTYGHSVDPGCLLYSWFIDDNRWAKDGFELFVAAPYHYTSTAYNIVNTSSYSRQLTADIYNGSLLHQFNPDIVSKGTLDALVNLVLVPSPDTMPECANNDPLKALCDDNEPFFVPIWFNKYMEIDHEPSVIQNLKPYVLSNSKLDLLFTGSSIAFSAEAYKLSEDKDISHLTRHFYFLDWYSKSIYKNFGNRYLKSLTDFGAGPFKLDDFHYPLQWPYFLKQLREVPDPENVIITSNNESGYYPCQDSAYYIFILKESDVPINIDYEIDLPDNAPFRVKFDRMERSILAIPSGNTEAEINPEFESTLHHNTLRRILKYSELLSDVASDKKLTVIHNVPSSPLFMTINKNNLPEGILILGPSTSKTFKYTSSFTKGYLTPFQEEGMCTISVSKDKSSVSSFFLRDAKGKDIENRQLLMKNLDNFEFRLDCKDGPFYIELYGSYGEKLSNIAFSVKMDDEELNDNNPPVFIFTKIEDDGRKLKDYWNEDGHHN